MSATDEKGAETVFTTKVPVRPMMLWGALATAMMLMVAACASSGSHVGQPVDQPTEPSVTSPTSEPPQDCEATAVEPSHVVDLDDDGRYEMVFSRDLSDQGSSVVVCLEAARLELEVPGRDLTIVGFHDLDDDGTAEILIRRDTGAPELGAVRTTLRGLKLTSIALGHWISDPGPSSTVFEGESHQCTDWDGDGDIELVRWRFAPADAEVSVSAAIVELDGLDSIEAPVDRFEVDKTQALEMWSASDGCGPDETVVRSIRFSDAGWARITLRPELFVDRDDLVLTAVAGTDTTLAAVGTEAPNVAVGRLTEARPVAWHSDDGISWSEARVDGHDAEILDVVAHGEGFLGVGRAATSPAVWMSDDGTDWTLSTLDVTVEGGHGVIYAVISVEGRFVAVGAEYHWPDGPGYRDSDAVVWTSDDAVVWDRIESAAFGGPGYQPNAEPEFNGAMFDVTHDPDRGFVAVGHDSESDPVIDFPEQYPAVWTSPDAVVWERIRIDHDARLSGIVSTDGLLVTYGSSDRSGSPTSDAVILTSADARSWSTAEGEFGAIAGEDGIQAINAVRLAPDGTWLALGSDQLELDALGAVAVWQSRDLLTWDRLPADPAAFGTVDAAPAPFLTDAATSGDGSLIGVGSSGETVELTGGGSVCCLYRPHVVAFDPTDAGTRFGNG